MYKYKRLQTFINYITDTENTSQGASKIISNSIRVREQVAGYGLEAPFEIGDFLHVLKDPSHMSPVASARLASWWVRSRDINRLFFFVFQATPRSNKLFKNKTTK